MNARSHRRHLLTSLAAAAFVLAGCFVYHSSAAPLPASLLSDKSLALTVPATPVVHAAPPHTVPASHSVLTTGGDNYRNSAPFVVPSLASFRHTFSQPIRQSATRQPVILEAYSGAQVVGVTNASTGATVRAPQSATDTSIGPNVPLTFTVRVNNDAASTTASSVYIQFKDPNSLYQDINLTGQPREHKVYTQDYYDFMNHTPVAQRDSGSAEGELFNGGQYVNVTNGDEYPYQNFTDKNSGAAYAPSQRGTVGGHDTQFITAGRVASADQGTKNPIAEDVKVGNATVHELLPGPDPGVAVNGDGSVVADGGEYSYQTTAGTPPVTTTHTVGPDFGVFRSFGQEYECQYLNAHDNGVSTTGNPSGYTAAQQDATNADYGTPFYLAGFDDQRAGSFGLSVTTHFEQQYYPQANVVMNQARPEWLKLNRESTDPNSPNYDLYQATWAPPYSPSDFYMDVIVVDSANNWRIYDNVWGFSTLPFTVAHDILVVSDNALGQKFVASADVSGQQNGIVNLRPVFYGAESYLTDIDVSQLPNATYFYVQPNGANPSIGDTSQGGGAYSGGSGVYDQNPYPEIQFLGAGVENGLGYGSYTDGTVDQSEVVNQSLNVSRGGEVFEPQSQAYDIWRILSRGPVPTSLLTTPASQGGYGPEAPVSQPAVNDPTDNFQAPAADGNASPLVPVSTRCVIWLSPFTGDQPLNLTDSLADSATQNTLRTFVQGGGRLFVTGQEVASQLTLNGQTNNDTGAFLHDVLNAEYASSGGSGTDNQTLAGMNGDGNFISFDSLFNNNGSFHVDDVYSSFFDYGSFGIIYQSQATLPLLIGNDYALVGDGRWRTDSALTQLGPYTYQVGGAVVQSRISTITPQNGATVNYTANGNDVLVYHDDTTDAVGSGYGSRVVFASFGLEGLGLDYFRKNFNNADHYYVHNIRPNILHNVVSYLRTGSMTGTIEGTSVTGSSIGGVGGATVYVRPYLGTPAIPVGSNQRQTYSTLTSDGTDGHPIGYYRIDGLLPGAYRVFAYKNGFIPNSSPINNPSGRQYTVVGDTTASVSVNIQAVPPVTVSGTVKFASGAPASYSANGAVVTFTGVPPIQVNSDGTYSSSILPGTYTGVATTTTPAGTSTSQPVTISVNSGASGVDFVITINPATISGTVVQGTTGVNGATVAFTSTAAGGATVTTTTATVNGVAGSYTSPPLTPGLSYNVSATAAGLTTSATSVPNPVMLSAGQAVTGDTITLIVAPTATLSGTVTAAVGGAAISGATITVASLGGSPVATTPTSVTTTSSGAYTLTLPEGSYNVTATPPPGTPYQSQTLPVTISTTTASRNFQLPAAVALASFVADRFSLVSWPYDTNPLTPLTTAFGPQSTAPGSTTTMFRGPAYNYQNGAYVAEGSTLFPVDAAHPGYGYFIKFMAPFSIYGGTTGSVLNPSTITVALNPGWNMIGTPSTSAISVSHLSVLFGGASGNSYPFDQAAGSNAFVSPVLYGWDPTIGTSGGYYPVVSATGPYARNANVTHGFQLQPFLGYWIYAYQGSLSLTIPTSGG